MADRLYPGVPDEDDEMPLRARLRALRAERGLSRSQLSRETAKIDGRGLPEITIKLLETSETNQPKPETVEILARALEIPPETFPEYRLALARAALDEREVGLREALTTLALIEKALRPRLPAELLAAEQRRASDRRPRGRTREGRTRREG